MRRMLIAALAMGLTACNAPDSTAPKTPATPAAAPAPPRADMSLVEPLAPDAFRRLDFTLYHVFVGPKAAPGRPFCAALDSADAWRATMQPAAVMGENLFAPPDDMWADHAVLLIARLVGADPGDALRVEGIRRTDAALDVRYTLADAAQSGTDFNWPIAVTVAKPLPAKIRFLENGRVVCETGAK